MLQRKPSLYSQRRRAGGLLLYLAALLGGSVHADNASLSVSAVIPTKNTCKFNASNLTLAFGTIDPTQASNITATATAGFVCNGASPSATFQISAADGMYPAGPGTRRMRHGSLATEYLPYAISMTPTSATVPKGSAQVLTVTGTLQPIHFQNAQPGSFQDTVVLTITP